MMARFYLRGCLTMREVYDDYQPPVFVVAEFSQTEMDFTLNQPPVAEIFKRPYLRRDYFYPDGFIGPHRDSDYHSERA